MLPPVATVAVAFELCVIVKVVFVGVAVTWNNLSSKSDALYPVPPGKVTLSNNIISPGDKPCAEEVVKVQIAELFVVAIVADDIVDFKGVTSYNWPSKYISKNLSVPIATYLFPSKSTNANCLRATPQILLVTKDDQPPTFSGSPYLNLVLSQSTHLFSAPDVVSCLSIPGKTLKSIRAIY